MAIYLQRFVRLEWPRDYKAITLFFLGDAALKVDMWYIIAMNGHLENVRTFVMSV